MIVDKHNADLSIMVPTKGDTSSVYIVDKHTLKAIVQAQC